MKLSLALGPRGTLSRQAAWGCFTVNLAMPGFGSIAAGRKVGYLQAALGLTGMALTMAFGVNFIVWYLTNYSTLQDPSDPLAGLEAVWVHLRWPLLGFAVFGLGWLWALASGLGILAQAKADERRQEPPKL